ncbi:hypothetical protein HC864_04365 [Candidatus Gracilibacteria bacterium]|nr:hypothetical protein [Candidatus Gracilibacteria bacterium]
MKNPSKNRGNKILIVLFVIFVIITGLVAYLLFGNIEPTIISKRSDDEITQENLVEVDEVESVEPKIVEKDELKPDLLTYSNPQYPTFRFDYPEDWQINEAGNEGVYDSKNDDGYKISISKNNTTINYNLYKIADGGPFPLDCTNDPEYVELENGLIRVKYVDGYEVFQKNERTFNFQTADNFSKVDRSNQEQNQKIIEENLAQTGWVFGGDYEKFFELSIPDNTTYKLCFNPTLWIDVVLSKSLNDFNQKNLNQTQWAITVMTIDIESDLDVDKKTLNDVDEILESTKGIVTGSKDIPECKDRPTTNDCLMFN